MTDLAAALSLVKDIALTTAGVTGTYVAIRGLSTWRRQLRGQTDYDVARKVLRCTYRFRDAFEAARSPFMWPSEMVPLPDEPPSEAHAQQTHQQQRGYRRRLQALWEAGRSLDAELLEAEVLWGGNAGDLSRPLWNAAIDLETAIGQLLEPRETPVPPSEREEWAAERKAIRATVYARGRNDADPFRTQVRQAVAAIETVVRRHIGT